MLDIPHLIPSELNSPSKLSEPPDRLCEGREHSLVDNICARVIENVRVNLDPGQMDKAELVLEDVIEVLTVYCKRQIAPIVIRTGAHSNAVV